MKSILLIALMLLIVLVGKTQNSNLNFNNGFKIYNLTSYDVTHQSNILSTLPSHHYNITNSYLQILHPSVAFQWKTEKNNFHEIELKDFILNNKSTLTELINDTSSNTLTSASSGTVTSLFSAQYEYIVNFNKLKESKFVPSLGFGVNTYFIYNKVNPETTETYSTSNTYFGFKLKLYRVLLIM